MKAGQQQGPLSSIRGVGTETVQEILITTLSWWTEYGALVYFYQLALL